MFIPQFTGSLITSVASIITMWVHLPVYHFSVNLLHIKFDTHGVSIALEVQNPPKKQERFHKKKHFPKILLKTHPIVIFLLFCCVYSEKCFRFFLLNNFVLKEIALFVICLLYFIKCCVFLFIFLFLFNEMCVSMKVLVSFL